MAYTGFPATYPQYYPQFPTTQQNTGIIWMQGIEAARAYPVAPNGQVVLFDSEQQCIYLKTADAQGRPSMRILDYTIRSEAPKTAQNALSGTNMDVPTRQDLNALQGQIDALKQQIEYMRRLRFIPEQEAYRPVFVDTLDELYEKIINHK